MTTPVNINEMNDISNTLSKTRCLFSEIDTPNLDTKDFGPHLLTTSQALNIAQQSATLIGSVARTIESVQKRLR